MKESFLNCFSLLSFPLSSVADEDPALMFLFHHAPLQLQNTDWSWNRLMIALSYWEHTKKKKQEKNPHLILPISPSPSSSVLRSGNWKRPANASGRHPKPNRGAITPGGWSTVGLKNLRLALSRSMIVSSAGVIWVSGYRVISDADEGRNGERRNYFSRQTENRWGIGE